MAVSTTDPVLEEAVLTGIKSREKYLIKLYERFTSLSLSLVNPTLAGDWESAYRDFERDLDECLIQTKRTVKVFEAADRDEQIHRKIQNEKETDVQKVKEDIERLKVELEKARQDRKNHEEHVAFAKKVREFPSRAQSQEDIDKVRGEIEQLEADKASLDEKTLIRSKQLHLLFFSIQQLLTEIDLDKTDEEGTDTTSTTTGGGSAMEVDT